jgi:23S rRNA pseudouridine2605 synthase
MRPIFPLAPGGVGGKNRGMKERIQKVLANAGVASRRQIERLVQEGRVSVNGRAVRQLPVLIDPEADEVEVDGERVKLRSPRTEARHYYLLNKPRGVHSTNVAQGAQVRAIDLLPPGMRARLYPVGRLDADSKGLLLLTNDGELTNHLTHPRYGVPKTYRAVVDGHVDAAAIEELKSGVWLADRSGHGFKTGRSQIRIVHCGRTQSVLEVTLREGRNREVRRILAKLGHKVLDLTRTRMGPLTLEGLAPGESRRLAPSEVRTLRGMVRPPEKSPQKPKAKARKAPPGA